MQQGRVSTIRFHEWICVCAQYEKAVARIGRQVYQGYARGLVEDYGSVEICKEISQAFADSKQIRADMEEEFERDALRGLSAAEAKLAEDVEEMSAGAKLGRRVRLKFTKLAGRRAVNSELQSYRDRVRDLSRDLGLRALAAQEKEPILKLAAHTRLCNLALKLDEDSNQKWEEIVNKGSDKKGGGLGSLSFHTILISFVANFASFSRNTALGKVLLKIFKYNPKEEEQKLTKQYEGTKTAAALEAQMAEVDEPDLDIGREMETMERDYQDATTDWTLPATDVVEAWVPDTSDTWASDVKAASPPPTSSAQPPSPAPPANPTSPPPPDQPTVEARKPQVLRQRSQPDSFQPVEAWVADPGTPVVPTPTPAPPPEAEAWTPPAAATRIGQFAPKDPEPQIDDWAAGSFDEEDPFVPEVPASPRLGGGTVPTPPTRPASLDRPSLPPTPPASALQPPHPLPPLPPLPMRSLDIPAVSPVKPPIPISAEPEAPSDDPLLRLLRNDSAPEPDYDDLLPAFLREREEETVGGDDSFIPELPKSLEGVSGLKILPFGTSAKNKDGDEDPPESFVPQMPDL